MKPYESKSQKKLTKVDIFRKMKSCTRPSPTGTFMVNRNIEESRICNSGNVVEEIDGLIFDDRFNRRNLNIHHDGWSCFCDHVSYILIN